MIKVIVEIECAGTANPDCLMMLRQTYDLKGFRAWAVNGRCMIPKGWEWVSEEELHCPDCAELRAQARKQAGEPVGEGKCGWKCLSGTEGSEDLWACSLEEGHEGPHRDVFKGEWEVCDAKDPVSVYPESCTLMKGHKEQHRLKHGETVYRWSDDEPNERPGWEG